MTLASIRGQIGTVAPRWKIQSSGRNDAGESMDKSSGLDVALTDQIDAWSRWNALSREQRTVGPISRRQAETVLAWIRALGRRDLKILDAGCGAGWLVQELVDFGHVTGIDFAADVLARARERVPAATFVAGDLLTTPLEGRYDVIVSLEVLAHVADQRALMGRFASLLVPGGSLLLATQNRPVLERWSEVGGPMPGTLRRWVDRNQLRELLEPRFVVDELISVEPVGDVGALRIWNAPKIERVADALFGVGRYKRFKERRFLGHTLMARARLR